ncbi:zinc finger protein 525-like [Branchiostoma lanceolatum]|uniref:zinc finger protein 525-like n=1 Tax=Branchiostoma lanceolatum TaxID=7740 RepID=UPI0034528F55
MERQRDKQKKLLHEDTSIVDSACAASDKKPSSHELARAHAGQKGSPKAPSVHICGECGYRAHKRNYLVLHMRKHTGEKPYKCDQCDYSAARKFNLDRHTAAKHIGKKRYRCEECGYRTSYKTHLSKHMTKHTDEKSYSCDQCDFSSKWKLSLENHMVKHTGEKPYMCGECGYRAAYRTHLTRHMRTHTGVRPYKCDQCDFSSAQKGNLVRHMTKHMVTFLPNENKV